MLTGGLNKDEREDLCYEEERTCDTDAKIVLVFIGCLDVADKVHSVSESRIGWDPIFFTSRRVCRIA